MSRLICPICDHVMKSSHYCKFCKTWIAHPNTLNVTYYLNEQRPPQEGGTGGNIRHPAPQSQTARAAVSQKRPPAGSAGAAGSRGNAAVPQKGAASPGSLAQKARIPGTSGTGAGSQTGKVSLGEMAAAFNGRSSGTGRMGNSAGRPGNSTGWTGRKQPAQGGAGMAIFIIVAVIFFCIVLTGFLPLLFFLI